MGYQTMINAALRHAVSPGDERQEPLTERRLREILREELGSG